LNAAFNQAIKRARLGKTLKFRKKFHNFTAVLFSPDDGHFELHLLLQQTSAIATLQESSLFYCFSVG
jgi:hypothetical protein